MTLDQITGPIRILLPAILAYAVGKGWIPGESVGDITLAVIAVIAAIWSIYSNRQSAMVANAAKTPDVTIKVGPAAPASVKAIADNAAVPNVVPQ